MGCRKTATLQQLIIKELKQTYRIAVEFNIYFHKMQNVQTCIIQYIYVIPLKGNTSMKRHYFLASCYISCPDGRSVIVFSLKVDSRPQKERRSRKKRSKNQQVEDSRAEGKANGEAEEISTWEDYWEKCGHDLVWQAWIAKYTEFSDLSPSCIPCDWLEESSDLLNNDGDNDDDDGSSGSGCSSSLSSHDSEMREVVSDLEDPDKSASECPEISQGAQLPDDVVCSRDHENSTQEDFQASDLATVHPREDLNVPDDFDEDENERADSSSPSDGNAGIFSEDIMEAWRQPWLDNYSETYWYYHEWFHEWMNQVDYVGEVEHPAGGEKGPGMGAILEHGLEKMELTPPNDSVRGCNEKCEETLKRSTTRGRDDSVADGVNISEEGEGVAKEMVDDGEVVISCRDDGISAEVGDRLSSSSDCWEEEACDGKSKKKENGQDRKQQTQGTPMFEKFSSHYQVGN